VRDNIHAHDVVTAFAAFHAAPSQAAVYNLGGGRFSNCSVLEAIELCEEISGKTLEYTVSDEARIGDHRWWISDLDAFTAVTIRIGSPSTTLRRRFGQIHDHNAATLGAGRGAA